MYPQESAVSFITERNIIPRYICRIAQGKIDIILPVTLRNTLIIKILRNQIQLRKPRWYIHPGHIKIPLTVNSTGAYSDCVPERYSMLRCLRPLHHGIPLHQSSVLRPISCAFPDRYLPSNIFLIIGKHFPNRFIRTDKGRHFHFLSGCPPYT